MGPNVGDFSVVLRGEFDSEFDTEMLETDPVVHGEAPTCDACGRFIGGRCWRPPHRADLTLHGRSWGDFAFRGAVGKDFLITTATADLYRAAGLTGLSGFEPVEIARVLRTHLPPPSYLHVSVELNGAALDESHSVIVYSDEVDATCRRCIYRGGIDGILGFGIEPNTWTGTDVFVTRGLPGSTIASQRFRKWAEANGLTNIGFVSTSEFHWGEPVPLG